LQIALNIPDSRGTEAQDRETQLRSDLIKGGNSESNDAVDWLANRFFKKLDKNEHASLQRRILNIDIKLATAEKEARLNADWSQLEALKDQLLKDKAELKPRYFLGPVINDYLKQYDDPSCKIKLNSLHALQREVAFILKTLGKSTELADFNSKAATDKLRLALSKRRKSTGELLSGKNR